ncbi:hypothetical protein L7F22_045349 [Adiantum nelumboides]|nr:hypothetical protein [Adiantum nelumboides]
MNGPVHVSRRCQCLTNQKQAGNSFGSLKHQEFQMASKAKVSEENMQAMRAILGSGVPDMDLIRCLHLARNDVSVAINILFDTPHFGSMLTKKGQVMAAESSAYVEENQLQASIEKTCISDDTGRLCEKNDRVSVSSLVEYTKSADKAIDLDSSALPVSESSNDFDPTKHKVLSTFVGRDDTPQDLVMASMSAEVEWWFLGEVDVVGFSTCKHVKLKEGEPVSFTFPRPLNQAVKPGIRALGRGRAGSSSSEIVRFSTREAGEIGRLPGDWARCIVPLVLEKKVKLEGFCKASPDIISLVDNITLRMKIYAHCSLSKKPHSHTSSLTTSAADKTVHPVPTLFLLLGLKPFKKAEFTPDDLLSKKRALDLEGTGVSSFSAEQRLCLVSGPTQQREEQGETFLSDGEVDRLVGTSDARQLLEMEPPATLACSLRPYQKQALHWMHKLESGLAVEQASRTLHPCWDAYHLPDGRIDAVYINTFSGDATIHFPSALQMARGGLMQWAWERREVIRVVPSEAGRPDSFFATAQMRARSKKTLRKGGGTLIVCPMTLLGQWKSELEMHTKPGTLTIYTHYGAARTRDSRALRDFDVVLTTYGVLSSDFVNNEGDGALHGIHWHRVVLDEAHTIKASKGQSAQAAFNLTADHRWCLTGTPIQNKLEDVFSLLHFLRIEPWSNWGWWNKLVQKPFQDGDERGLRILQAILQPLMLRRTKESTDEEGRPILELPPIEASVVDCEFSEAERDFYDALYKKSKVKFDKFVEQGRVLHNYASILELLLRLRQCCDHPFLVLSRGDTEEYADMGKLAKRLIGGHKSTEAASTGAPTKAFVWEVIEDLQKTDKAECPICLEAVEDAVLTPCAHSMCRECLFASWNGGSTGSCPICRMWVVCA